MSYTVEQNKKTITSRLTGKQTKLVGWKVYDPTTGHVYFDALPSYDEATNVDNELNSTGFLATQ